MMDVLCGQGSAGVYVADGKQADVFEEVQAFNDHGKVLSGVHESFLGVRFNDPTLCKVSDRQQRCQKWRRRRTTPLEVGSTTPQWCKMGARDGETPGCSSKFVRRYDEALNAFLMLQCL